MIRPHDCIPVGHWIDGGIARDGYCRDMTGTYCDPDDVLVMHRAVALPSGKHRRGFDCPCHPLRFTRSEWERRSDVINWELWPVN